MFNWYNFHGSSPFLNLIFSLSLRIVDLLCCESSLFFFLNLCDFLEGHTHGMWRFLGQGSNAHHSSNLSPTVMTPDSQPVELPRNSICMLFDEKTLHTFCPFSIRFNMTYSDCQKSVFSQLLSQVLQQCWEIEKWDIFRQQHNYLFIYFRAAPAEYGSS